MRTFAQTPSATRSPDQPLPSPGRPAAEPMRPVARVGHDFSRIPLGPPAAGLVIRAKLAISRADDEFEQDADRVADLVMRGLEPPTGRAGAGQPAAWPRLQTKRVTAGAAGQVAAPASVQGVLSTAGQPLDGATRGFMEPRFGHDLSHVRVHADAGAAGSARSLAARAYTVGAHIVFGAGEFTPATSDGRRLLAHELAHVAQQGGATPLSAGVIQRQPKPADRAKDTPAAKTGDAPAQTEDPKITALKAQLVKKFGLSAVTDPTDVKWTIPQLEKMDHALDRLPQEGKDAIKGVELRRLAHTTEVSATAQGLFKAQIDAATGIRQDRIEIADDAFELDKDYDAGGAHTEFGGVRVQGAPSEGIVAHEVGHALEAIDRGKAEAARIQATVANTAATDALDAARKAYDAAVPAALSVAAGSNAKERAYKTAIEDAAKKLGAVTKALDGVAQTPTAAQLKTGATAVKRAVDAAKTAVDGRNTAHRALPGDSAYLLAAEEEAQDKWLAAAVAMQTALDARAKAQAELETATDAPDTQVTIKVSSGQSVRMTIRLAEFVALVEVNRISIPDSDLGSHVLTHWPNNPEEAYAELYSFAVTAPGGMTKWPSDKNGAMASFFTSPVGPKGAQKTQAKTWIAAHRG